MREGTGGFDDEFGWGVIVTHTLLLLSMPQFIVLCALIRYCTRASSAEEHMSNGALMWLGACAPTPVWFSSLFMQVAFADSAHTQITPPPHFVLVSLLSLVTVPVIAATGGQVGGAMCGVMTLDASPPAARYMNEWMKTASFLINTWGLFFCLAILPPTLCFIIPPFLQMGKPGVIVAAVCAVVVGGLSIWGTFADRRSLPVQPNATNTHTHTHTLSNEFPKNSNACTHTHGH
eukprot:GDKI01014388.1.p1 GENE.GDKI01014388.1~~GDKI01014388.1.p1  ORF type:complete len:233 (+),score=42.25 GDKI01014388.1:470-1168(+)